MNALFLVVMVAVIGGAIWTLTRKKAPRGPISGGGNPLSENPKGPINEE
jgi:hypothetical protein